MKIKLQDLIFKNSKGVYSITNTITNQKYIGSVPKATFKKRFKQHFNCLKNGTHENTHLQRSYDKYGSQNFVFEILHVLENLILEKEQRYLSTELNLFNKHKNAFAPPNIPTQTSISKQVCSRKIFNDEAGIYYLKLKNKEIEFNDIPKKFHSYISFLITKKIWNKGLTKDKHDYSCLKVPKNNDSEKYREGRESFKEKMRSRNSPIEIYDYLGNYIRTFRCPSDIVEYTKRDHDLPLIIKDKNGRKGKNEIIKKDLLEINNILKVCKGFQKQHKGLIFKYENNPKIIEPLKPQDIFWNIKSFEQLTFLNHKLP